MTLRMGIQRPMIECPVCGEILGNDNDQSYQAFCHFRVHGMALGPSGRGKYTCHCGFYAGCFYDLNEHICNTPHDWPSLLTMAQLKEMP